jgi:hypothetical protein
MNTFYESSGILEFYQFFLDKHFLAVLNDNKSLVVSRLGIKNKLDVPGAETCARS